MGAGINIADQMLHDGDLVTLGGITYEAKDVTVIPLDGTWDGLRRWTLTPTDREEQA